MTSEFPGEYPDGVPRAGAAGDRDALWRIMATRRDHRHFDPDPVPRETVERLLSVFELAPSVGLSQPWHVTVVTDPGIKREVREGFAEVRERERERFSGGRRVLYDSLTLEAIETAPVGLVVSFVPPAGATLGTTSMPAALEYSVVCAIAQLWLAVTAEGLGMGWVSLVDPARVAATAPVPEGARPLAYLCIGTPSRQLDEPLLHTVGWKRRQAVDVTWS